jgi:hypothetical protein
MTKQLKTKIIAGIIVLISVFCFVYLNTRNKAVQPTEGVEYRVRSEQAKETPQENRESSQIFKTGLAFLIKALVLSNK